VTPVSRIGPHKDFNRQDAVWRHTGNAVGRREGEEDLPGAVIADTAGAAESDVDTSREPSQTDSDAVGGPSLPQRCTTPLVVDGHLGGEVASQGSPGDLQLLARAP